MTLKRFEALKPWIEGKRVLHIGCVEHDWQKSSRNDWIHNYIVKYSKEAIGIDILKEDVRELVKRGYRVEIADAQNFDLNTKFDVIFSGELIEHLQDFIGFLDSCKRHMRPDSKLIITTPNSFGVVYFIVRLFGIKFVNPEHMCWFDEQTIEQLLNRHSLEVIERKFLPIYSTRLSRIQNAILQVIEILFPKRFRATLFIVSQKHSQENTRAKLVRVAMVDHFQFGSWYSWYLARELSKLLPGKSQIYLYGPKGSKNFPSYTSFKAIWSSALYPLQIAIQALRDKVNIVHIQFEFTTFGSAYSSILITSLLFLLKFMKVKVIVTIHGPIFPKGASKHLFESLIPSSHFPPCLLKAYCVLTYKMSEKMADAVIVHADIFKKWLNEHGVKQCHVIPHGVEVVSDTLPNRNCEDRTILCFGVLSARKGIENLILAFSKIKRELPNYRLIIAGGESRYYKGYLSTLRTYAKAQGVGDRVTFTGYTEDSNIPTLFRKASLIVIPYPFSIAASGPLAMAMGYGKPIIATATEYFSEVLEHGKDAWLVPPGDEERMSKAISGLCTDEDLRSKLSQGIRNKARKYEWREIARKTFELYTSDAWR